MNLSTGMILQNFETKNKTQHKQSAQKVAVYSKASGESPKYERKLVYGKSAPMPAFKSRQYQTVRLEMPKQSNWKRPYENHKYEIPETTGILVGVKKKTLEDLYEEISRNWWG